MSKVTSYVKRHERTILMSLMAGIVIGYIV